MERHCKKCDTPVADDMPPFVTAMQEEIATLETSLAERWENLNVQDGVIAGLQEEIAALRAENAAFRRDMKGDYDLDAWLDWCYEAEELRGKVAALEKVAVRLYNLGYHSGHEDTVEGCYTHIYEADMDEYHDDIVADILREARYLGGGE
jgi:hypothetical protein